MTKRTVLGCVLAAGGVAGGFGVDRVLSAAAEGKQDLKPAVSLPMTRVVLFNSGVGYFSRSGEVEGDARVDLAFQETDVNDLLKSLVLEDFGNGRIAAVSYDSREPISRTLASFAINLNQNPTFADILAQARGERVEVTVQPGAANQPGKLSGAIVGIEQRSPQVDVLNLWCAEGLRAVKLAEIQQLRFANPAIESEFRRALEVVAMNHDSQKKSVSLHFAGDGKRKVQVGYVIEAPIWKTSYRLILDAKDKGKPYLQGWAMVENPTDEDWTGVKMALVSGRPISFKMDLYNPLFVPRPTVEPDLFASLRPPTYDGGFGRRVPPPELAVPKELNKVSMPPNTYGIWDERSKQYPNPEVNRLLRQYQELIRKSDYEGAERVAAQLKKLEPNDPAIAALAQMAKTTRRVKEVEKLKSDKDRMFADGLNSADRAGPFARDRQDQIDTFLVAGVFNFAPKFSSKDVEKQLAARIATGTVDSAATGAHLGDFFQYAIDHPVSLARQKSALLPIVGKEVEGSRVSIYNPAVQAKHPLLGLRFKNTSGLHLAQGPITVFEGSTYAGDTRVLDVQPNEERLVSYAIDLGTEVDPQIGEGTTKITSVKAVKGIVTTNAKIREVQKYRLVNRSQQDRTLILEHPNRTNQQFKLVETEKPIEDTREVYRFQMTLKAGEEKSFVVTEERDAESTLTISNAAFVPNGAPGAFDDQLRYLLTLNEASPSLKAKLNESLKLKGVWDSSRQELTQLALDLNRLNEDQDRIRKNLASTPKEAEVYQTYLKKLSDQEKEIDTLTAKQKKLMDTEFAARKRFEDYLANLSD